MAGRPRANRIRVLDDGLMDEQGQRWDRIQGQGYYMTHDDVAAFDGQVTRFLTTGGYGTSVVEVTRAEFEAALVAAFEHRVTGHRRSQGDGAVALLLDTSDC